jgi:hypothetical protein
LPPGDAGGIETVASALRSELPAAKFFADVSYLTPPQPTFCYYISDPDQLLISQQACDRVGLSFAKRQPAFVDLAGNNTGHGTP